MMSLGVAGDVVVIVTVVPGAVESANSLLAGVAVAVLVDRSSGSSA